MPSLRLSPFACLLLVSLLGACAHQDPLPTPNASAPAQWQAPLPHNGQRSDLTRWWEQFNDPLLARLVAAAQEVSPTLAAARARIEDARAARAQASGALWPNLNAAAGATRGRQDLTLPITTTSYAGLQAAWEIDAFGGTRSARDAAQARIDGADASWHTARVSLAAEVATTYVTLRACEAQVLQTQADSFSRNETARLTDLSAQAGFESPANAALARASAAQGNQQLTAQRAQCNLLVKSLVALTALDEPGLRSAMAPTAATLPQPAQITVASVPAEVLNQRPDLYTAALDVVAASSDVSYAQAQRYPRITLGGSIYASRVEVGGFSTDGTTWAVGPLQLTLPLFDGGARAANVDAARARYDAASVAYLGALRAAVREVEEALIQLQSANDRVDDARIAAKGFNDFFVAAQALQRGGLGSLFDLELARRSDLLSQSNLIDVQREQVAAWIALYRALGGGWTPPPADPPTAQSAAATPARN